MSGLAVAVRLAADLARSGEGRGRACLLAGCAAVSTALLLVAWTMLLLPADPDEVLFNLVAEPGLRGGTALATVLLVLPVLLLVHQTVRLGTSARERRLAALRLAGGTPGQVRAVGMVEVGVPVLAGAVAGLGVYLLLRMVLGGTRSGGAGGTGLAPMPDSRGFGLVPTSVTPAWWQFTAVIVAVVLAGFGTGMAAGRHVVVSPLGVTRRVRRRVPRPWGLLLLAAGTLLVALAIVIPQRLLSDGADTVLVGAAAAVVLGSVPFLAPWLAALVGRRVEARTPDPATLLAARRLAADPGPAGRAGAATGAVGMVTGVAAVISGDVFFGEYGPGADPLYVVSFGLLGAAVLAALVVGACTLLVQTVESLMERRRPLAALVAAGVELPVLRRAQFQEAWLATAPLTGGGTLLGPVWYLVITRGQEVRPAVLGWWLLLAALTVGLTRLAVSVATRLVDPWLVRACSADNLRVS